MACLTTSKGDLLQRQRRAVHVVMRSHQREHVASRYRRSMRSRRSEYLCAVPCTSERGISDLRGRSPFGKDNMNGSTANRVTSGISGITATSLGAVGGDQSMQSHLHNYGSVTTSGGSVNTLGDIIWAVSGGNVVDKAGSGYLKTSTLGTNTGTGNSQNMPPTIILNYIIKY